MPGRMPESIPSLLDACASGAGPRDERSWAVSLSGGNAASVGVKSR